MMGKHQLPLSERAYNYMLQCFIIPGWVLKITKFETKIQMSKLTWLTQLTLSIFHRTVDDANTMIENDNKKKPIHTSESIVIRWQPF